MKEVYNSKYRRTYGIEGLEKNERAIMEYDIENNIKGKESAQPRTFVVS